ncbi:hypothetical protein B0H11DRAFT_2093461 [Mycena galericulata]|nr:hypothetical protein B0H11DRAFT_2093461 [Mycena galericulata]
MFNYSYQLLVPLILFWAATGSCTAVRLAPMLALCCPLEQLSSDLPHPLLLPVIMASLLPWILMLTVLHFLASVKTLVHQDVLRHPPLFTHLCLNPLLLRSISSVIFLPRITAPIHVYLYSILIYLQFKMLLLYTLFHIMIWTCCNVARL